MQDKIKSLLGSTRFWAATASLITIIAQGFGLTSLTEPQIMDIVVLISSWVVGSSVRRTEILQSRRFWATVASLVTVFLHASGVTILTEAQVSGAIILVSSWILGDSIRKTGGE